MTHQTSIETTSFAELYHTIASALVTQYGFQGKETLRRCIRHYGTRLGQLRRELLTRAGQKTNLKHVFDCGWGIPCSDGAVREWTERSEQQIRVNVLSCPFAQIWLEANPELGHAFCEEFYPAYVKAATDPNTQVNVGKTLLNEGDEFCQFSCYLRPSNLEPQRRQACFAEYDPSYQDRPWSDTPLEEAQRCALFLECIQHILREDGLSLGSIGGV